MICKLIWIIRFTLKLSITQFMLGIWYKICLRFLPQFSSTSIDQCSCKITWAALDLHRVAFHHCHNFHFTSFYRVSWMKLHFPWSVYMVFNVEKFDEPNEWCNTATHGIRERGKKGIETTHTKLNANTRIISEVIIISCCEHVTIGNCLFLFSCIMAVTVTVISLQNGMVGKSE